MSCREKSFSLCRNYINENHFFGYHFCKYNFFPKLFLAWSLGLTFDVGSLGLCRNYIPRNDIRKNHFSRYHFCRYHFLEYNFCGAWHWNLANHIYRCVWVTGESHVSHAPLGISGDLRDAFWLVLVETGSDHIWRCFAN